MSKPAGFLDESPPRGVWRLMVGGTLLVILAIAVGGAALAQGAADPRRAGALAYHDQTFAWMDLERLDLAPDAVHFFTAPFPLPETAFTIDLQAALDDSSDPSSTWGIWLADGAERCILIAISAEGSSGYVTARRCPAGENALESCDTFTEPNQGIQTVWKISPFLKPPGQTNRIALYFEPESGVMALRINYEWMWDIPLQARSRDWGIWARGGRENAAVIEWQNLQVWLP